MSDKRNITVSPTPETTFGTGEAAEAEKAYRQATLEAERVYSAAHQEIDADYNAAAAAVNKLLGRYSDGAININGLLNALSAEKRSNAHEAASTVLEAARRSARRTRDEALSSDPFTKFVTTHIRDNYSASYANSLLENMPFTFTTLKDLANSEGWCSDYEAVMQEAVRQGALPDEKVTVSQTVPVSSVPDNYNAKAGESWQRIAEVPAYVRLTDSNGDKRTIQAVRRYLVNDRYERIEDAKPSEA